MVLREAAAAGSRGTRTGNRTTKKMKNAIAIAIATMTAGLVFSSAASAEIVVNLGTVTQIYPRPVITYTGSYGAFVTTRVDTAGVRTITSFDISAIAQQLGGNLALVEIRVRDTGTNSYGMWSPGADIDLMKVVGADLLTGTVTTGYLGTIAPHIAETSATLANRLNQCDAISGDDQVNMQHYISLGRNGVVSTRFSGFAHGQTGGSGSGGAGGPGGWDGSGGGVTVYGGVLVAAGMKLEISEAGTGESFGAELVFESTAVPAPGAMALLAGAGLLRRRRR